MHSISLINTYIGDFHILIQGPSNIQVCIGKNDFPIWWILMFGYSQLRKWDPSINFPDKLCGKAFSLKGVQCKQWDPGIAYFGENLQDGLMEKVKIFAKWIHAPFLLHDEQIFSTLRCFCLRTSIFGRGGLSYPLFFDIKSVDHDEIPRGSN